MIRWQLILSILVVGLLGVGIGSFVTNEIVTQNNNASFDVMGAISIQDQVKILEMLRNDETEKVLNKLETQLNTKILALGPNSNDPRPPSDNLKAALIIAARYREKHPFPTNSPGTDQMVKDIFKWAN